MTDRKVFEQLRILQKQGVPACLATIVNTAGSTPRKVGAKMIICADGTTYGTVGGGCGESQVRSAALECLLVKKQPLILEVDLTADQGTKGNDVCGGKMLIFVEPLAF